MEGSAAFLLDVLLLGVSCFLYLVGVELEEEGDAVGVGAGWRKAVCLVNERSYALNGLTIFIPQ